MRKLTFSLLVLATAACRAPAPEPPSQPVLTDAHIAGIVLTANTADILYAEMALAKSDNPDVRAFARMMKSDHSAINDQLRELAMRLRVDPLMNEIAFDLRDDAEVKRLTLRDLEGFAFDSAYAVNEVNYHTTVLGAIDSVLIPAAEHPEVKALLEAARPAVAAHLEHARELSAKTAVR